MWDKTAGSVRGGGRRLLRVGTHMWDRPTGSGIC